MPSSKFLSIIIVGSWPDPIYSYILLSKVQKKGYLIFEFCAAFIKIYIFSFSVSSDIPK